MQTETQNDRELVEFQTNGIASAVEFVQGVTTAAEGFQVARDVFPMADQLKALKVLKDALAAATKAVNGAITQVDVQMVEAMTNQELQSFNRGETTFYLSTTTRASSVRDRGDELRAALMENGHGALVKETVNPSSLAGLVRELLEDDEALPTWLDGLVNVYQQPTVNVRKA